MRALDYLADRAFAFACFAAAEALVFGLLWLVVRIFLRFVGPICVFFLTESYRILRRMVRHCSFMQMVSLSRRTARVLPQKFRNFRW